MSIDDRGKRQLEFHVDRRGLLRRASAGFPLLSLYGLLSEEVRAAEVSRNPLSPRQPHHAPRAKSVIFLFMGGGPSQVDLFDPKPKLADHTKIPIKLPRITRDSTPNCRPSPFRFQQHGESGTWFSELMPNLSRHADDLCIVRSVYCDQIEHSGAIRQMTTGDGVLPRPSVGAWSLYGLGSENDSLPGFVSISRQSNLAGKVIHGSSFLPAAFEGTSIPDVKKPIANLAMPVAREIQATRLAAIRRLAEVYRRRREDDSRLDARLAAYELAFRMQTRAPKRLTCPGKVGRPRICTGSVRRTPTNTVGSACWHAVSWNAAFVLLSPTSTTSGTPTEMSEITKRHRGRPTGRWQR